MALAIDGTASRGVRFARRIKNRFHARIHMILILHGVVFSGICASKALLWMGMDRMVHRYPICVAVSYAVFYGLVRLWLGAIAGAWRSRASDACGESASNRRTDLSGIDGGIGGGPSAGTSGGAPQPFGGGKVGGGGASRAWNGDADASPGIVAVSRTSGAGAGGGRGGSGGFSFSFSGGGGGGDEAGSLILLLLLALFLAALFGGGVYLIVSGPDILAETAFQFALATGLIRDAKSVTATGWAGSLFRKTALPFALILFASILLGAGVEYVAPEVRTMPELLRVIRRS